MSTLAEPRTYTPDDLLRMPDGDRHELVDGNLVERNASALSSLVAARVLQRLANSCEPTDLAWVFGADCSYQCLPRDPEKVRRADVSLILRDRLTAGQLAQGHLRVPPDLAVEVVSPNDLAYELEEKVQEYLEAGVRLVWVIYPPTQTVSVRRRDRSTAILYSHDELSGEDVLPGFVRRVGELFEALPPALATPGT